MLVVVNILGFVTLLEVIPRLNSKTGELVQLVTIGVVVGGLMSSFSRCGPFL
jgi:hypothetical protein